jgi:hypothetical protein
MSQEQADGKRAPSTVRSHAVGGENQGSGVTPREFGERGRADCPEARVKIGGVMARCLLDSGSEVSLITESFFKHHFGEEKLYDLPWLKVRAANDQEIPYLGYTELGL